MYFGPNTIVLGHHKLLVEPKPHELICKKALPEKVNAFLILLDEDIIR